MKNVGTKILRPSGTGFKWCINQYDGCSHGCLYCYGMTIRKKKYNDWIKGSLKKVDVLANLRNDIQKLRDKGILDSVRDIFLGSITDSYQPLEREHKLTRAIIGILKENELPFTLLTKSSLILRDVDLLKDYDLCRVGVTLTSFDESIRQILEPGAMSYSDRVDVLIKLKEVGVFTYVSCEPIMPIKEVEPVEIVKMLSGFVDLFEFGMWNKYRYKHIDSYFYKDYSEEYYVKAFKDIIEYCESKDINYCIASHSKDFVLKHGLSFKPYPLVKESFSL